MQELSGILAASLWPICTAMALIGCLYALFAADAVRRMAARAGFSGDAMRRPGAAPNVSILKPLYGAEPGLAEHLASFCRQDYPGAVEVVFGVQRANDPAVGVVTALIAEGAANARLVQDAAVHGTNRKVSNLINIFARTRHEVVVLADSDIVVEPDYLARVTGSLQGDGVGLVTCLYNGVAGRSVWSRLSALGIDYHFLPSVLVGLRLGLAKPCFGSTIALRRETLESIGGFESVANQLADDYALGDAVRRRGLEVAIPPFVVGHACSEASWGELWAHDLRWARTIRMVDPVGHAGSAVTHALPFALIAGVWQGGAMGLGLIGLALACRSALQIQVDRFVRVGHHRWWLGPIRDVLSFAVFLVSLFPGAVTWRGGRFGVRPDGSMSPKGDA